MTRGGRAAASTEENEGTELKGNGMQDSDHVRIFDTTLRDGGAHAGEYTDDVEFSPEDGSRSDVEFMAEVIQVAIDEGATTINVPDTVGYTMPHEYAEMFTRLYELVPKLRDVVVSVHCHD